MYRVTCTSRGHLVATDQRNADRVIFYLSSPLSSTSFNFHDPESLLGDENLMQPFVTQKDQEMPSSCFQNQFPAGNLGLRTHISRQGFGHLHLLDAPLQNVSCGQPGM